MYKVIKVFYIFSKKLEHYKKRYHKERQLRKRAERRLIRLQTKIKESHILDEGTVSHIETCFQKFQKFLSHLQDIGYCIHVHYFDCEKLRKYGLIS